MTLGKRFLLLYLPSVAIAALLPIHLRRAMTRAHVTGGGGDLITWDWELLNWPMILERWPFIRSEGQLGATVTGAVAITLVAGAWIALGAASVWWLFAQRARP